LSFVVRGVASVPVIAIANGIAMILTGYVFNATTSPWDLGWVLFWFTTVIALLVGAVLAGPALALGKYLPAPKLLWLCLFGAMMGPVPFTLLQGASALDSDALLIFSPMGVLSALLWWVLVERTRPPDFARGP
jgi:hypothetical protein